MKRFLLLFLALPFSNYAQTGQINAETYYGVASKFAISRPVSELSRLYPVDEAIQKSKPEENNKRLKFSDNNPNALPIGEDPARQANDGTKSLMPPIQNWQGMAGSGFPPDPSGAAGPNHYVQAVNTTYRVYSKTGSPLTNAFNLSALWSGSTNDGDPIVMYDRYADRWFISQFQGNSNEILMAVSTTPDPTGTYYTYSFTMPEFPDYPKYSVWSDAYVMTCNMGTKRVVAYDRIKMLAGDQTAGMIIKNMPTTPTNGGFFCPLPADADGGLPPNGTPCPIFSFEDDSWTSSNVDAIRIYKFTLNWTNPASSSIVLDQSLNTTAVNSVFTTSWNDIVQPNTTQKLDAISGVLYYRAQYRRWVGYNSVVLCHAADVDGNNQAGIRWYELRQDANTLVWSIYQQSTYSPDANSRFIGSIAMDNFGSIGLAYAVSSGTVFPSIRYTGRLANDPLNTMTFTEETAIAGTTSQTGGINRYGDYSHTSLDPDGITFWHTGEYVSNGKKTRIFSFQITTPTVIAEQKKQFGDFQIFNAGNEIKISSSTLKDNTPLTVDLFDINGKLLSGSNISPQNNSIQTSFNTNGLSNGTYLIRVGNSNFQKVEKIVVGK
jgi:hypothetical protein